jgi:hypothetical protein
MQVIQNNHVLGISKFFDGEAEVVKKRIHDPKGSKLTMIFPSML